MHNKGLILEKFKIILVFQPISRSVFQQQKRYRGKINITKPRPPHREKMKVLQFATPFISNPDTNKPVRERCLKILKAKPEDKPAHPYDLIIARECLNWFKSSNMIAIFHTNPMKAHAQFDFAVALRKANMYLKGYQPSLLKLAFKDTYYEPLLKITQRKNVTLFAFSPDINVNKLQKILKKTPAVVLLAGIIHGKLLNLNEFVKIGALDLVTAQAGLVQVLRSSAGGHLNQQLTHHQSTLVTRLKQIGTKENEPCDENK